MAEVGSTFPTGPEEVWGSDFTDMGFVTPDGLEEALEEERTQLDAWGEDAPVVDLARKRTQTCKLAFRQPTPPLLWRYYQVAYAELAWPAAVTTPTAKKQFLRFGSGSLSDTVEISLGL